MELEHKSPELDDQIQALLGQNLHSYHGPDTIEHLKSLSLGAISAKFSANAPDVVELIHQLGNCSRHEGDEDDEHSHAATIIALSTLLKCCSVKVLGLQLFLSIMLIARATNKRLYKINTNTKYHTYTGHDSA